MLLTELALASPDDRSAALIADSLARGDRWIVGPVAADNAVIAVTLAPGTVASLVEVSL